MPVYDLSLWDLLKRSAKQNGNWRKSRLDILELILNAVIFIQKEGYCHLDIKPSNVMLNIENNTWNGRDLVLCDFGLSTAMSDPDGQCGTPGFGSPEQFVGRPSLKSDNFGFAKTAVLLMFDWNDAWNLLAQPILPNENNPVSNSFIHDIISKQLLVNPADRPDLTTLKPVLHNFTQDSRLIMPEIFPSHGFDNSIREVSDNTQASIAAIVFDKMFSSWSSFPSIATSQLTRCHDQQRSYLCHSFATISSLRNIIIQMIQRIAQESTDDEKVKMETIIRDIKSKDSEYCFQRMIVIFCCCVNPRSFHGVDQNQAAVVETVVSRLVYRTAFEIEGWKRIIPIRSIFKAIKFDINDFILSYEKVFHHNSPKVAHVMSKCRNQGFGESWFDDFRPSSTKFQVTHPSYISSFSTFLF